MKSGELKFANPLLNRIDFEIMPKSLPGRLLGISLYFLVPLLWISTIAVFMFLASHSVCYIIFTPLVLLVLLVLSSKLIRFGRRLEHNPLTILNDQRHPVLYLRSFKNDAVDNSTRMDRRSSEELLCSVLEDFGPIITVGNPLEKGNVTAFLGATRIFIDNNWKEGVEKLMSISSVIVIEADNTESLLWEMKTAFEKVAPQRIIISFLSQFEDNLSSVEFGENKYTLNLTNPFYERFRKNFINTFSLVPPLDEPNIGFIYFDPNKNPKSISLTPAKRHFYYLYSTFLYSPIKKYYLPIDEIRSKINSIFQSSKRDNN